jgi:hypothetical protein
MISASEVLSAILEKPTDLGHDRSLVTDDVTYVSLNYENPDLHSIMPWCGTHKHAGPKSNRQDFRRRRPLLAGDFLRTRGGVRLGRICRHVRAFHLSVYGHVQARDHAVRRLREGQGRALLLPPVHGRHPGHERLFQQRRAVPQRSRWRRGRLLGVLSSSAARAGPSTTANCSVLA